MSESSMWSRVRTAIKELDPVRIENKLEKGTPDVNYVEGWIELKWCRHAPKRGGIVKLDHEMTKEQRLWHIKRNASGGRCFVFLKIRNEWLLFKGHIAADILGYANLVTLREKAIKTWLIKLNDAELREILTSN